MFIEWVFIKSKVNVQYYTQVFEWGHGINCCPRKGTLILGKLFCSKENKFTPAKFWPRSQWESRQVFGRWDCRDLSEISKSQQPKTRRDSRRDLGEISKSRRDSRWDLGEILKSRRPKTRRDSHRDLKISSRFSLRSQRDLKISAAKDSPRISTRFQVRS